MCGIVGYVGSKEIGTRLIEGLKRLEYRGYDSSGLSVIENKKLEHTKRVGRVKTLEAALPENYLKAQTGICHTRWATHGDVTEKNAHPHISSDERFALVHNGVIENYLQIKQYLESKDYTFCSDTDSEIIVNLIAYHFEKEPEADDTNRFLESVRKALLHLEGTYGIAVISKDYPDEMICARRGSPLIIGVGKNEHLIASDVNALTHCTQNVVYLNDNEIVHLTADDFSISTISKVSVDAVIQTVDWDTSDAELGGFQHFMEKEIFEQPTALENGMRGRFSDDGSTAFFGGLNIHPQELSQIDRIIFIACGTAWHACLIAEYLIERFARIPVEVEYASEFRYRNAPLDKNSLVIAISQSGETIDSLSALKEAKRKGYKTLSINNSVGSSIARECDGGIYQHAGPEIGVASTKAFTSQVMLCAMLALYLGRLRNLSYTDGCNIVKALKELPKLVEKTLESKDIIQKVAKKYAHYEDCLFLGRQLMFPIALEGALKAQRNFLYSCRRLPSCGNETRPDRPHQRKMPNCFLNHQRGNVPKEHGQHKGNQGSKRQSHLYRFSRL